MGHQIERVLPASLRTYTNKKIALFFRAMSNEIVGQHLRTCLRHHGPLNQTVDSASVFKDFSTKSEGRYATFRDDMDHDWNNLHFLFCRQHLRDHNVPPPEEDLEPHDEDRTLLQRQSCLPCDRNLQCGV